MTKKAPNKYACPECQGPLTVWADVDAELTFSLSKTGKLKRQGLTNNAQSDGRCGIKCQSCNWRIHGNDVEDESWSDLLGDALGQAEVLELAVAKRKVAAQ